MRLLYVFVSTQTTTVAAVSGKCGCVRLYATASNAGYDMNAKIDNLILLFFVVRFLYFAVTSWDFRVFFSIHYIMRSCYTCAVRQSTRIRFTVKWKQIANWKFIRWKWHSSFALEKSRNYFPSLSPFLPNCMTIENVKWIQIFPWWNDLLSNNRLGTKSLNINGNFAPRARRHSMSAFNHSYRWNHCEWVNGWCAKEKQ